MCIAGMAEKPLASSMIKVYIKMALAPPPPPKKKKKEEEETPACLHFYFFVFAIKRCPNAAKIAGLIGFLPRCVCNNFFTQGYECLPNLCGLSKPLYFVYGKLGLVLITVYTYISLVSKKKKKKKNGSPHKFLKPTYDQKPGNFFWGRFLEIQLHASRLLRRRKNTQNRPRAVCSIISDWFIKCWCTGEEIEQCQHFNSVSGPCLSSARCFYFSRKMSPTKKIKINTKYKT